MDSQRMLKKLTEAEKDLRHVLEMPMSKTAKRLVGFALDNVVWSKITIEIEEDK